MVHTTVLFAIKLGVKLDIKVLIEKATEKYTDKMQQVELVPLQQFCAKYKKGKDLKSHAERIDYIKTVHKDLTLEKNSKGVLCVCMSKGNEVMNLGTKSTVKKRSNRS